MSLFENRKSSGMVLTGVVLSFSVVNAMNWGVVGAVPQSKEIVNGTALLGKFAGEGAKESNVWYSSLVFKMVLIILWLGIFCYVGKFVYKYLTSSASKENKVVLDYLEIDRFCDDVVSTTVVRLNHESKGRGLENFFRKVYAVNIEDIDEVNIRKMEYDISTSTFKALDANGNAVGEVCFNLSDCYDAKEYEIAKDFRRKFFEAAGKLEQLKEIEAKENKVVVKLEGNQSFEGVISSTIVSLSWNMPVNSFSGFFRCFTEINISIQEIEYDISTSTFKAFDANGDAVGEACFDLSDFSNEKDCEIAKDFRRKFFKAAGKLKQLEEIEAKEKVVLELEGGTKEFIVEVARKIFMPLNVKSRVKKFLEDVAFIKARDVHKVEYDIGTSTFKALDADGNAVKETSFNLSHCLDEEEYKIAKDFRKKFFEAAGKLKQLDEIEAKEKENGNKYGKNTAKPVEEADGVGF